MIKGTWSVRIGFMSYVDMIVVGTRFLRSVTLPPVLYKAGKDTPQFI
jgi:hypothetical protein